MFDMLSDIGGLSGILVSAFAIMAGFWNYLAYDNYLVSHLYTVREASTNPETDCEAETKLLKANLLPQFKEMLLAFSPCKCPCKRSRQEAAMLAAREKLEREIDIVTIIKSKRYTALALKALLPRK